MNRNKRDIKGQRFGMLVAQEFHSIIRRGAAWTCLCDCGKTIVARTESLVRGDRKTCGCATQKNKHKTHGMSHRPEYTVWVLMHRRCHFPATDAERRDYHDRGIRVCDRWKDFAAFMEDMGPRPRGGQIERTNNDGGYEPSNCRWASTKEQARNKRNTHFLEFQGMRLCISDWAERVDIKAMTLWKRINAGWDVEKALTQPVRSKQGAMQC